MRRVIIGSVLGAALALRATPADARAPVFYGTAQVGVQNHGDTGAQYGLEAGVRILVFEGYLGYMRFGAGESVSRAILGVRGAIGSGRLRLVLRLGGGAIREQGGTLSPPGDVPLTRTGGVARGGIAVEVRPLGPPIWLGVGADGESYGFFANSLGVPTHDSDVVGTVRLTFEYGR